MIRYIFILIFLFVSEFVYSQYNIMFNDTLKPFGSGAYSLDNVQKNDTFYYVTGIFVGVLTSNNQQPFVLKINKYGTLINKKLFADAENYYAEYFYNSTVLDNNKLLQLVIKTDTLNNDLGTIIAINKNTLDTLWTKTYLHPDTLIAQTAQDVFSVLTSIKPTPDGGYILTGNYNKDCITGNLRSFLMKIDSVGNVEWRRTYTNYYTFFDIEVAPDSGYYVPCTYNDNDIYLTKFDKYGNFKWKVQSNSNNYASYPTDVSILDSQNVVISSSFWYDVSNYKRAVTVAMINVINKTVVWENNYFPYYNFKCVSLHQAMGVETLANGDIIVSGTAKNFGLDAFILKLNSNGDSLWCKSYDFVPDPYDCQLNDLIITDDGGFMGVGFWSDQSGPGWTAWMFKTDANGVVGWEETKPLAELVEAKVYPNPARDYTTLKYNCSYRNLTYSIIDVAGREIKTDVLKTIEDAIFHEVLVDLSSISPGTYYFVVKTNNEVIYSEKLMLYE